MFYRARTAFRYWDFNVDVRAILNTKPIRARPEGNLSILSMLCGRDFLMYLVAIKAFYRWIDGGEVIVINDGTLTERQRYLLHRHVEGIREIRIQDIDTGLCQRGGTWERLLTLIDLSKERYAIQLDADFLVSDDVPEVRECVAQGASFLFGGPILEMPAAARAAQIRCNDHFRRGELKPNINLAAQAKLIDYPGAPTLSYANASSSFAGMAKGAITRANAERFHSNMEKLVGRRWLEWGSEQIASNFLVANSSSACALPWPKYMNYEPDQLRGDEMEQAVGVHFLGTYRFQNGVFAARARKVIQELGRG